MTSEVRKCPKMGFCTFFGGLSTPWGPLWAQEIWKNHQNLEFQGGEHLQKISYLHVQQTRHFWEKHVFLNFSRFLQKYRISVYISIIFAPTERKPTLLDLQKLAGNYGILNFVSTHQVDELRNRKCETHIEKLTAMGFRNLKKLSIPFKSPRKDLLRKN